MSAAVGAVRGAALGTARSKSFSLPRGHSDLHVKLTGLPRTATPADITRLLGRNKIHNITKVALEYQRFEPTGSALLTLSQPSVLPKIVGALKQLRFFGHTMTPRTLPSPTEIGVRSRGLKGREEASQRNVVTGNGYQGGITDGGRSVLLSGLPGRISADSVRKFLRNYKLMGGQAEVVKLETGTKKELTSRVLVRLSTASEAFKLVRNVHMTNYEADTWEDKYTIRAQPIH
ncbi:hypothetical protein EDB84DRAFT_1458818 [Lactarius hengduanensis]|nr:hypothetical protein EDB84DRAFT_1458818 [Lactarius hengduanensis]